MRTALAFFILFLVLGSVYFQSANWQQWLTKTYRSPVESQKVVESQTWPTQFSVAGTGFLTNWHLVVDKSNTWWIEFKNLAKSFWQALSDYVKAWPARAKHNWLKFLGYSVDDGERTLNTKERGGEFYSGTTSSTDYNMIVSTSTSSEAGGGMGRDLDLAVAPANNFTLADLQARFDDTFSDPVEINISASNNDGVVIPQFREGPGRTYIFLLKNLVTPAINQ